MKIEFDVNVVEVGNILRVALPKEVLGSVGVQKGDILHMTTHWDILSGKPVPS